MIKNMLEELRDAAYTGDSPKVQWQNIVEKHTLMGCNPEVAFYVEDWWETNQPDVDFVCAQWCELPEDSWERKHADSLAHLPFRFVVKTKELSHLEDSYYVATHVETDEEGYPLSGMSWLDAIAYLNKKSLDEGLKPVYYFKDQKTPFTEITEQVNFIYEDDTANGYKLPNKEEWITTCLAGRMDQDTPWGDHKDFEDSFKALDPYVWCLENSHGKNKKAGTKLPNQWGFYDTLGLIFEYTDEEA